MTDTCPSCSQPATGRFCPHCGTSLGKPGECVACGAEMPANARFCNHCGTAVAAGPPPAASARVERSTSNLPWIVAGVALVALIAVLLVPRFFAEEDPTAAVAPALGDPSAIDLSSMTPREAADRLFNRVMRSVSAGDSAQARSFLPMALAAYGRVPNLDADGRYHLAVLHLVDRDASSARAEADTILASAPNHLFGLFSAAQAEAALGNPDAEREFYRRFLEVYDAEVARGLPGYTDHAQALPIMRQEAEDRLAGP
ncbi:MAG TPA: zinc ribbon domain-containing protein [Longimicrobiaceae bacterium]|nr:zinc ribbon domain-containing protein [Longimicrobiaceae bacterium]